ncbi:hypothetical protein [Holdemania massiliensis]|uniref:Uncharacterized protein n=1 Tax=Holdemania massiliensis TaxID=1468449 RepID=A0A6N7SC42_9FIRM|nr:hypothetical protein [Holdemania massiliensis]MSA73015.1 hypothetical protein [Holdemania massiliensis]MSA91212.1 hypothetical protein [Holdemania massiliensis]MSB80068.1 hypothetical protein [Holdemania massiliensis]MSC34989.1 hypothetical protein [Holdemania massiliensis]MSC41378.1 hypothetical protein [Holdemania massiliensis]
MATSSFTQKYEVKRDDAKKLLNIINDDKTVRVPKVTGHKDVKGKAILNFLGLRK